ncbi:MAG: hypothetical protein J7K11_06270 [Candidatus Hydrothermae bacterium]|nr:hypothetical protein [Candidatus Hydrothermae bacterium]
MARKISLALKRGASCVGCDIAVVNLSQKLFDLLEIADIVFSPTLLDVKYDDLKKIPDKSITIGLYHGAVRNSDNEEFARIMRDKCQVLIAYGACAHMGGIRDWLMCQTGRGSFRPFTRRHFRPTIQSVFFLRQNGLTIGGIS